MDFSFSVCMKDIFQIQSHYVCVFVCMHVCMYVNPNAKHAYRGLVCFLYGTCEATTIVTAPIETEDFNDVYNLPWLCFVL